MKTINKLTIFLAFTLVWAAGANAQNDTIDEARVDEPVEAQTLTSVDESASNMASSFEDALGELGEIRNWDPDGDGSYNSMEFFVTVYQIWDLNHDSRIDEDEWQRALERYVGDNDMTPLEDFSKWDADGNSEININEFSRAVDRSGLYSSGVARSEQTGMKEEGTSMNEQRRASEDQMNRNGTDNDEASGSEGETAQDQPEGQDQLTERQDEMSERLSETARGQDPGLPMEGETDIMRDQQENGTESALAGPQESIEIWDEDDDGAIERISAGDWSRTFDQDDN